MKNIKLIGTTILLATSAFAPAAFAQDPADIGKEHGVADTDSAEVTRETNVHETDVVDANAQPLVDEADAADTPAKTTDFEQTVDTPSGDMHSATKEDGAPAIIEREGDAAPQVPQQPEMPVSPSNPEKPVTPVDPQ